MLFFVRIYFFCRSAEKLISNYRGIWDWVVGHHMLLTVQNHVKEGVDTEKLSVPKP